MPTIDQKLRYYAVKVNRGSGCIFQPDTIEYTYVLTVKHNIQKADHSLCSANEITIQSGNLEGEPIAIVGVYPHDNLDIAVIVVEYIGNRDYYLSQARPKRNEQVRVFGYPDYLQRTAVKVTGILCTCDLEHQPNISFEFISNSPMVTF